MTACATAFVYIPTNVTGTIASAVTTDSSDKPISIDGDVNTDTQTNYIDLLLLNNPIGFYEVMYLINILLLYELF